MTVLDVLQGMLQDSVSLLPLVSSAPATPLSCSHPSYASGLQPATHMSSGLPPIGADQDDPLSLTLST